MESRNLKKLLFDVEKACERIEKFVSNCSLDDFLNNEMLLGFHKNIGICPIKNQAASSNTSLTPSIC